MQTARCYELDLEQFISFLQVAEKSEPFSEQMLVSVDANTIKSYIAFLKSKKYSRSSTARKLASLRTFYKFLGKRKSVDSNPAKAVHIPKPQRHQPKLLEDREARKLLEAPPTDNWLGVRNKALLQTLYSTGVRVGELVALNVDDIDLANGLLYVRAKGKKERIISLERPALCTLADYIKQRNGIIEYNNNGVKALFLNKFGRRLSQRDVRRKMDKYLAAAGLDRSFSPRSLRHSFAARKLHTGCDLSTVKELLGHQALVSTQVYAGAS